MDDLEKLRQEIINLAKEAQGKTSVAAKINTPEFKEKFKAIIGDNWDDPVIRHAIAKYVTEIVYEVSLQQDLTAVLPVNRYAPNEEPIFRKKGKLRAYYLPHGADALTTQMFQEEFRPVTNPVVCAPAYDYDAFKNGRYGDMADQTREATREFIGKKNQLIYNTLAASMVSGAANYAAAAGGITKTILDVGIDYVASNSESIPVAIIGHYRHLAKIRDFQTSTTGFGLWTEEYKKKILKTGLIDVYMGVPIIPVKQYIDGQGLLTISDTDIYILSGDDWGRFIEKGPYDTLEEINAVRRWWILNMKIDIGMYIWDITKNYRIVVSGI